MIRNNNPNRRNKMRMVIVKVTPMKTAVVIISMVMKLVMNRMVVTAVEVKTNIVIVTLLYILSS